MATIFTKIIQGEIPSYKVAEDDSCYAFLDIFPLVKGHVLVVPKIEVDELYELPKSDYENLMKFSKKVAQAIKVIFPEKRVASSVIGLEVPHAHIHLMPINSMNDMNFSNEKLKLSKEEFQKIASDLSDAFVNLVD